MNTEASSHVRGQAGARVDISEKKAWSIHGVVGLLVCLVLLVVTVALYVNAGLSGQFENFQGVGVRVGTVTLVLFILVCTSIKIVNPGETAVLQLFGQYVGTVRTPGLRTVMPLTNAKKVSIKVRNFETNELKVNDADGNPINIAAVVVWQVADTAKAVFAVTEIVDFVRIQAEAGLRHVANSHPYDVPEGDVESLRGSTDTVSQELAGEVADRIAIAGLEVVEVRISSLAYAPEIAHAMLQRQQAAAVIAAREKIVDGAVSMVESALRQLEADDVVALDDERRAAMVSNLLVVLCGSAQATPVVNTGTLYG